VLEPRTQSVRLSIAKLNNLLQRFHREFTAARAFERPKLSDNPPVNNPPLAIDSDLVIGRRKNGFAISRRGFIPEGSIRF
jgi:hypothetical protein